MTDQAPDSDQYRSARGAPPGMPRWLKVLLIAVLVVAAALVIVMILVPGQHGPGLHTGSEDTANAVTSLVKIGGGVGMAA